ncbi:Asparagine synthetase [glutamine-hydrolyzing] 1 [Hartmannibacter diazotrophicus]|uniref:asparagine synthase (glutamine-hydrolyzing) n=1 Tax=Hartmannibacter diazotrophicus TaxID=1482074 RepID=A0A2C9DED8_9HYPH|nr:N-acetylglutaminylglutamine amidotransferase [Hartmannibacter diazotrophicus]SON58295.1 Asparagine synthetase [glutamine-hydrolyzing] 1 [Hartmannibacter diazotrophicus]
MCGICGELTFDGSQADVGALARMNDAMIPRGPDASGIIARGRAALGHRRLKILDLSERSQQPMVDADLGLSIAFNGCIYNYRELRADLEAKGYRFFSGGDTEVILKAYHAWGPTCVERFHGMFAFAIAERDSGRVVLARDRFGIKPLYLAELPGKLRFASSLPALVKSGGIDTSVDPVALHHYMSFHAVVPAPHTILKGIRKLPPATIRVVEPDGSFKDSVYWRLDFSRGAEEERVSAEDWQDQVLAALRKAVERRIVADVPVGVLLSGGVDSSLIVALLAEAGQKGLKTFSVGFESVNGMEGDEFKYSDIIARRYETDHTRIFVPSRDMIAALPGVFAAQSEPMVSYDNVGFYLLSKEVAKHVTVVQSGQGADEVFAGYHWYPPLAGANDPVGDYAKVFFDRDHAALSRQLSPEYLTGRDESRAFVAAHMGMAGAEDAVDKALRLDSTVMLVDDPVKRVDNMTMAFGLEARVPFLDHELVELAARIPPRHKVDAGGKKVLKDVARRILPSEVIDRKKGYFPVPALKYIEGDVLDMVRDALGSQAARERGIFNQSYVDDLIANPKDAITPLGGSELWQVATLELWLQAQAA